MLKFQIMIFSLIATFVVYKMDWYPKMNHYIDSMFGLVHTASNTFDKYAK